MIKSIALGAVFFALAISIGAAQEDIDTETTITSDFPDVKAAPTRTITIVDTQSASEPLPDLESFIDGIVESHMAGTSLPGVTVSVVKDGGIVFLKGYGYASLEDETPVDPSKSMFRIGSITKTFTGIAVMQLVDQGKIDLDADINTYLTQFKIPHTFAEPITMGTLLSHRPGFEDSVLGHLFNQDPKQILAMGDYLAAYMPERIREPGAKSAYSNYGLSLAGHIVELVSGQDFATYLEENIFQPLGMEHTTIREPLGPDHPLAIDPALEPFLATGYAKGADGNADARPFDYIHQTAPAGSISSTAEDMARYMIVRLNREAYEGGRLVSETISRKMRTRHYSDRPLASDFAYTMMQGELNGRKTMQHSGGTTTFFSNMIMLPEENFGIFMSTNSSDGGPILNSKLPSVVIDHYFPSPNGDTAPAPSADFAERGQIYMGTYGATRRSYSKLEKIAGLVGGQINVSVDQDGYLVIPFGGKITSWVEIEPGVFQRAAKDGDPDGNRYLYFYSDDEGQPTHFSVLANDHERIRFIESTLFFFTALIAASLLALTTIAGAWRRAGRGLETSGPGRVAGLASLIGAFSVLVIIALIVIAGLSVAGDPSSIMFNWPPGPLLALLNVIVGFVALSVVLVLFSWVVWTGSKWGLLRRVHYTLFALACCTLIVAMAQWNLVGWKYF